MKNFKISKIAVLALAASSLFIGCKKDDDSSSTSTPTPSAPAITAKSVPQISFTVDGTQKNWVLDGSNNVNISSYTQHAGSNPETAVYSSTLVANSNMPIEGFKIKKGTHSYTGSLDSAKMMNFFPIQTVPFSVDAVNGIHVQYNDANGIDWTTSYAPGDQSGSTFKILDKYFFEESGDPYVSVKMSFSCKLKNDMFPGTKTVSGTGVFVFSDY